MDKLLKNFARLAILGLIIFEFLNGIKILNFTLEFSWFGLIVTASIIWLLLELLSNYLLKSSASSISGFGYALCALGIYMDALGDILRLYSRFSWYDQFAHFVAGGIVGFIVFNVLLMLNNTSKILLDKKLIIFFTIAANSLFAGFYEIEEYLEDEFLHGRPLRLGDGPDTANDLMLNILGSVGVILLYTLIKRFKKFNSE